MAIFTSTLFAMLHDVTSFTESDIWNILSLIGFSFIAIYMVVRWNIFATMGFHAAWNFIALCIPLLLAPMFEKSIDYHSVISGYMHMKIEQVGDKPLPDIRIIDQDSVILTNISMTEIVRRLSVQDNSKYVLVDNIDEVRYNVIGSISSERDLVSLKDSIVRRLSVVFDTVKPSNKFMLMSLDDIN